MTRPQVLVNVAAALQERGAPTDTGVAFMVYAGATGSTTPVDCYSKTDALASLAPDAIATYVGDALTQGAPKVTLLRAAAVDASAVTQAEWATALAMLTIDLGPGQVLIPGITTTAAHDALLAHGAATGRCVLLDAAEDAAAADIATLAVSLAAAAGSTNAGLIAGWSVFPTTSGATRVVPGSVIAAGLCGRGDAAAGHANNAPAADQGRGAGYVHGASTLSVLYSDSDHDTLNDAGVCVFRVYLGQPQLYGWVSLSTDPNYRQLNWGRMAMQLRAGIAAAASTFLFRQIDAQGFLYSELAGMLRGYLAPLWAAGALFGTSAADAFGVDVAGVNTPSTVAAGELHAAVDASLSPHTEKVVIDVVTNIAQGA
ncbi:hypothetical protein Back2_17880 [Nocardioides baekrokdamisoli]|uniref:Tail sheath protein subtilisin-like domain-containing protein n=1 Tax=Nocardioides baekrokdamisoli TaxID=1804624 RepID=A0A3G9IV14_9ACTN|nr:hypothetical protein [Nocardioides baekrokdamisoli]BBH17501.1 hypothetical protein Back2_17880 [Nocardioides baekrokdamisoli]